MNKTIKEKAELMNNINILLVVLHNANNCAAYNYLSVVSMLDEKKLNKAIETLKKKKIVEEKIVTRVKERGNKVVNIVENCIVLNEKGQELCEKHINNLENLLKDK